MEPSPIICMSARARSREGSFFMALGLLLLISSRDRERGRVGAAGCAAGYRDGHADFKICTGAWRRGGDPAGSFAAIVVFACGERRRDAAGGSVAAGVNCDPLRR